MAEATAKSSDRTKAIATLPSLDEILDRTPLTVTPDISVSDAIAQMGQTFDSQCHLDSSAAASPPTFGCSCCVLAIEGLRPVGILTERDVVRLSITDMDLSQVTIDRVMTQPLVTLTLSASETVYDALALFQQHQIRHLPVVDDRGELLGILTRDRLCQILEPANLLKLRQVAELMATEVIRALPADSILSIARQMANERKSCVVVVEPLATQPEALTPLGIVTERDMVQFQILGINFAETEARTVMSTPLCCLKPTDSLWQAQQEMRRLRVRRLVVAGERGELRGILTQTSLLRAFDPVEMAGVIEMMQQQLDRQSEQLNQTFEQLGREIAERQQVNQAEVELREQQQLLERVTESTSALLYIYDLVDRRNAYVNAQITNLLGYSPEEIQAMGSNLFANLVHPDDLPKLLTQLDRCFRAADGEIIESEYRMRDVNGDWHWLQSRDSVLNRNADGTPKQAIGTAIDITERQQAEAKIREQAVLLDISTDAIYVRDLNDCILYWNQGAEKVYGWSAAEALGRPSEELFDTDPAQREVALATTLEKGSWQGELLKTTQSGKAIVLDSRWSLMKNEAGQPHAILTVSSDITDKKQLEAQFLRAQRLESIGTLASGIAHDLNNILTPVLVVAQILPRRLSNLDESTQRLLDILEPSVRRGSDLAKQILAFARGSKGDRLLLQIGHLLLEIGKIIRETFPNSIELQTRIPTDNLWLVRADATQIHQAILNLCVNARDAMPEGGMLTLAAENCQIDRTFAQIHLDAGVGPYVKISVADTGMGMTPDILDSIFDPFFTTKEPDKGTGLGLSTVLTIVKNHGGFLDVTTAVGCGTSFEVYLPAIERGEEPSTTLPARLEGNGELILVVDDEVAIGQIIKTTLEEHNYQVLVVQDGIEAMALYAQQQSDIHLVLVDLVMPSFDGLKLIAVLSRINPQVRIVAMSGGSWNNLETASDRELVRAFLEKPFTAQTLLETMQQALVE